MRRKVVCVLNRSPEYDFDYVEKLRDGVLKYADVELTTIVTSRWPGWWSKISLFEPEIRGDFLYFDLDTVITGPIDDLFIDKLTVLADFNLPRPNFMATGVMFIPEREREPIWKAWIANPDLHMSKHRGHGDGGFLSQFWKAKAARWQDEIPGRIVSYKKHCRDGVPQGASVVCFHGRQRPRDVDWRLDTPMPDRRASRR